MSPKQIFQVHSWAGLAAAFALVSLAVSGALLIAGDELDASFFPHLYHVAPGDAPAPLARTLERVVAEHPAWSIARVRRMPQRPDESLVLELQRVDAAAPLRRLVYVNPYDGSTLGTRATGAEATLHEHPFGFLLTLHRTFYAGRVGLWFALLVSLLCMVATATGVVLHRRHLVSTLLFRRRWRPGYGRLRWWHEALGSWSLPGLLLWSVTGFGLGLSSVLAAPSTVPSPPPATLARGLELASRDGQFHPWGAQPTADDLVRVSGRSSRDSAFFAPWSSALFIDVSAGAIARDDSIHRTTRVRSALAAFYSLHVGSYGGWPLRLTYLAMALIVPLLTILGVLMRLLRWRRLTTLRSTARKARVSFRSRKPFKEY